MIYPTSADVFFRNFYQWFKGKDELIIGFEVKGKGKGRVLAIAPLTWVRLSTRRLLQSRKWQLMIQQRSMRPSIARVSEQFDPRLQLADIPPPESATLGLHPVARKLLLISRPAEGRRLSWPEHTVVKQSWIQTQTSTSCLSKMKKKTDSSVRVTQPGHLFVNAASLEYVIRSLDVTWKRAKLYERRAMEFPA